MDHGQFLGGLTLTAMDRLVGWRRKASRCGLTPTPIDLSVFPRTCRPPGSFAVRFASPMHVTQEGPDALSRYCPVQASGSGGTVNLLPNLESQYGR